MAFRAVVAKQWRSMLANSSTTASASASFRRRATTSAAVQGGQEAAKSKMSMGDWAPIMIIGGFVAIVVVLAGHSGWQQLAYHPGVQLKKKKRETLPEVYTPDELKGISDKFINNSFLRKVGHIQGNKPESSRPDPYTVPRKIETPK